MTAAERRRGGDWERAVVGWLRTYGWQAERAGGGTTQSYGDVIGVPGWVLELKDDDSWSHLGAWCDKAAKSPTVLWAVIKKRRRRSVSEAYVILSLVNYTHLLKEAGY